MMKPRYTPRWRSTGERLIGYAGELDVYIERFDPNTGPEIYLVGPPYHALRDGGYNFDQYRLFDGAIQPAYEGEALDMHVELSEMCEVYQVLQKAGVL